MWKLMISFWRDNDNDGFSGGDGQSVKAVKNTKSYFFSFYLGACRFDENYWYIAQLATAMFCLANEPHSPAFFYKWAFYAGLVRWVINNSAPSCVVLRGKTILNKTAIHFCKFTVSTYTAMLPKFIGWVSRTGFEYLDVFSLHCSHITFSELITSVQTELIFFAKKSF